jgi:hypothetical protein
MTLSALLAVLSFALWIVLAFVVAIPQGWPHLLYAVAILLAARRIIVGAPKFLS